MAFAAKVIEAFAAAITRAFVAEAAEVSVELPAAEVWEAVVVVYSAIQACYHCLSASC